MYADLELWTKVRRCVLTGELSKRAACREYALSWHTLAKMLAHQEPPGYRRKQPRRKPKLEPFLPIIHEILKQDGQTPRKQRHTAWRIFERLRGPTRQAYAVEEQARELRVLPDADPSGIVRGWNRSTPRRKRTGNLRFGGHRP